ncbi:MAG: glycosyltransferase [Luteitalea sp.]|nr:glycosyltransferase [Luteitalea sp.]
MPEQHPQRRSDSQHTVSVVVPVWNERESLEQLHAELVATADQSHLPLEIIFVDDGSHDGSWETIRTIAGQDSRVRAIRLRRNFGKAAALSAGFRAARGQVVMTMDADLQDNPADVPRLLAALDTGYDLVSGWKRQRHDPWHRVLSSHLFNVITSWSTGVSLHDHNCGLKAYRREVLREVALYGELHRFMAALAHARGFRVGEIPVNHRRRRFGQSKYGISRSVKGLLDLAAVKFLTGFGGRPHHLLGTFGLVALCGGLCGLGYLAVLWVLRLSDPSIPPLGGRPLMTYSAAALIVGVQLASLALLASLVTAYAGRERETYSVAERIGDARRARKPRSTRRVSASNDA